LRDEDVEERDRPDAEPVRPRVWGEPEALSVRVTTPERAPVVVGVKVTVIEQLAAAAREEPQLLVWAKSPEAAMVVRVRGAVPELVNFTICAALVVPMVWEAKVRLVGERVTAGCGRLLTATNTAGEVAEAK